MTTYYIIDNKFVRNTDPNCENSTKRVWFLNIKVTAETKIKAQNKAKKIDPRLSFSGMFGAKILTLNQIVENNMVGNLRDKAGYLVRFSSRI